MRERIDARELMDRPSADPVRLMRTVRQFRTVNLLLSRSRGLLRNRFIAEMRSEPRRAYRLLDIGAGGCDLDRWLVRRCRRLGLKVEITCLDHDARVVALARRACRAYPEIRVMLGSDRDLERMPGFDFVFSNHFLHHLSDGEIAPAIERIRRKSGRAFLLNDMRRSWIAYYAFSLFARAFLHRSFAFHDGRMSIRRAFRADELGEALGRLDGRPMRVRLLRRVPFRLCLYGVRRRPPAHGPPASQS